MRTWRYRGDSYAAVLEFLRDAEAAGIDTSALTLAEMCAGAGISRSHWRRRLATGASAGGAVWTVRVTPPAGRAGAWYLVRYDLAALQVLAS